MVRVGCVWVLLFLASFGPGSLQGQLVTMDPSSRPDSSSVRRELGFTLVGAQPVGNFADYVELGGGFSLFGVMKLGSRGGVGLRLDLDLITYGSNTVRVPLSPTVPFVDVDVTTDNSIASIAIGPQLVFGQGRLRPFLHGSVGVSQLATTTSVWNSGSTTPFASTQNYEDHAFFVSAGGGLRIVLSDTRRHPLGLELGVHYVRRGLADYLREEGIYAGQDGETVLEPIRSETDLINFHFGMTLGFR